ncbi:MAG TPA: inositol monophosphatase [Candidatus Saccharimonadales bacterium]
MDDHLKFAKRLALQAGKIITDNYGGELQVRLKPDNTPVSEVDEQINEVVVEAVRLQYPEHGLLGEEGDLGDGNEEFQWLCDPLDGTRAFILGIPISTFCLALTQRGQALLSVVYHPFSDRLFHAVKGGGAFCNDRPISVNDQGLKGGYILLDVASYAFMESLEAAGAQQETVSGSGYEFMLIASGRAAAMIKNKADYHDVGPGSLIVEEAGGKVSALDGSELLYDKPIEGVIVSNGTVHEKLIEIAKLAG